MGRLISKDRYRADPQDSIALKKFCTPPKTVGELHSLLGFLGYYHCYVKNFSKILKPLYDLLKKDITQPKLKKAKTSKKKETSQLDSKTAIEWTEQHQLILNKILDILKSTPTHVISWFWETIYHVLWCIRNWVGGCSLSKSRWEIKSYVMLQGHLHQQKRTTTFTLENVSS